MIYLWFIFELCECNHLFPMVKSNKHNVMRDTRFELVRTAWKAAMLAVKTSISQTPPYSVSLHFGQSLFLGFWSTPGNGLDGLDANLSTLGIYLFIAIPVPSKRVKLSKRFPVMIPLFSVKSPVSSVFSFICIGQCITIATY